MKINKEGLTVIRIGVEPLTMGLITINQNNWREIHEWVSWTGEVAAALARNDQDALRDGIGDVVVTLIILAMQNDMDLYECLNFAYDEIKGRTGKMVNGVFVKSSDL